MDHEPSSNFALCHKRRRALRVARVKRVLALLFRYAVVALVPAPRTNEELELQPIPQGSNAALTSAQVADR